MPIGIMGSNSLVLLDWGFTVFHQEERRKHEYMCLRCFPLSYWNTLSFNQATMNHHYPQNLLTLSRTLLHFSTTTFLATAVFVISTPMASIRRGANTLYAPNSSLVPSVEFGFHSFELQMICFVGLELIYILLVVKSSFYQVHIL